MNKKKRFISFLLALTLLISSVPVFAASKASISHQIYVEKNSPITIDDANSLKIVMQSDLEKDETFKLVLTNAQFIDKNNVFVWNDNSKYTIGNYKALNVLGSNNKVLFRTKITEQQGMNRFVDFEITSISKNAIEIRFLGAHDGGFPLGVTNNPTFETLKNREGFDFPLISYALEGDMLVEIRDGLSISSYSSITSNQKSAAEILKEKSSENTIKQISDNKSTDELSKIVSGKHFGEETHIRAEIKADQVIYEIEAKDNMDFELPKGVKVVAAKMKIKNTLNNPDSEINLTIDPTDKNDLEQMSDYLETDIGTLSLSLYDRDDYSVLMLKGMRTKKAKPATISLDLYLSADVNFKETVNLITNLGSESLRNNIAYIESPLLISNPISTYSRNRKDIRIDYITLNDNSNIGVGENLEIELSLDNSAKFTSFSRFDDSDDNIKVNKMKVKDGKLIINFNKNTMSEFNLPIYNLMIEAENKDKNINLYIGGSAIAKNTNSKKHPGIFAEDKIFVEDYIVFDNSEKEIVEIKFTDGKAKEAILKTKDGTEINKIPIEGYIDKKVNRAMIGLRQIANILDIDDEDISWDIESRTVTIIRSDGKKVSLRVSAWDEEKDRNIYLDDKIFKEMDTAAVIIEGRIYLPISSIAEILDVEYNWEQASKTVSFYY